MGLNLQLILWNRVELAVRFLLGPNFFWDQTQYSRNFFIYLFILLIIKFGIACNLACSLVICIWSYYNFGHGYKSEGNFIFIYLPETPPRIEFPLQSPLRFLKFWLWRYSLHVGVFGVRIKGSFTNLYLGKVTFCEFFLLFFNFSKFIPVLKV